VGSLLVGVISLLLLGWRLHRMRRQALLAEAHRGVERRSEERIRALVEHSSDVITVVDRQLIVRWQSPSVGQLLGYDSESLIGRRLTEFVESEDVSVVERLLVAGTSRPGAVTLSARFRHASGDWRHVEAIAENRLADPAVRGV